MKKKNRTMIITFLAPALLCYVAVFLYPSIRTIIMSFFNVEGVSDPVSSWTIAGLGNYRTIFKTPLFIRSMINIGKLWLVGGILVMVFALFFAVSLTSGMKKMKLIRSIIYLQMLYQLLLWVQSGSIMFIIQIMDFFMVFSKHCISHLFL